MYIRSCTRPRIHTYTCVVVVPVRYVHGDAGETRFNLQRGLARTVTDTCTVSRTDKTVGPIAENRDTVTSAFTRRRRRLDRSGTFKSFTRTTTLRLLLTCPGWEIRSNPSVFARVSRSYL